MIEITENDEKFCLQQEKEKHNDTILALLYNHHLSIHPYIHLYMGFFLYFQ